MLLEKIKLLINYGILAPSSHNSQPWAFKMGENYLEIYADTDRRLKESDKEGRMLFTAMGCLIANLKIAADYFSVSYDMKYCPINQNSGRFILTAKMIFFDRAGGRTANGKISSCFQAIPERRSNRNRYEDQEISAADIRELSNLNNEDNLRADFITDLGLKSQVAEISSQAMKKVMSDALFRRELAYWLRTNWTFKKDGMPGNGHGMSLPVSFAAPFILRHVDVSEVEAKKEKIRILNFPTVAIISSKENNPENWIKTGELLEVVLLAAQSKGIDSVIRVASIAVPEAREKLKNALHLGNFHPQMLFGLGRAEKRAPHSPRRKIEEVTI